MALAHAMLLVLAVSLVSVNISITPTGAVHVEMLVQLHEGLNSIPLPVPPIVPSIIVNESGRILIPVYQNGTLYVYAPSAGTATIDYVANVTSRENVFQFSINANYSYRIEISNNIVLLTLLRNISKVYYHNGMLVIVAYGPQTVQYIVRKIATTTTTITHTTSTVSTQTTVTSSATKTSKTTATSVTTTRSTTSTAMITSSIITTTTSTTTISHTVTTSQTPTTTITTPQTTVSSTSITKSSLTPSTTTISTRTVATTALSTSPSAAHVAGAPPYLWIFVGIAAALAIGLGIALGSKRRSSASIASSELSPLDKDIINEIEQNGGSILQSELQKRLGIPKTTLWRHIRKLERLGIVKVVKEGGYNKIVLVKKP